MTRTTRTSSVAIVVLGLTLAGCSSTAAPGDPASTSAAAEPITLQLAFTKGLADEQVGHFQDEVVERGKGSLAIAIAPRFSTQDTLGVEQDIIEAVQSGEVDIGLVGARAFRELGIRDFDALVAPMAIDSLAGQEAVLRSDVPSRMLAGLEQHGVSGLAVVAGPLRRPIAAEEALTTLDDFAGIPFYTFHGEINRMTVETLGASNVDAAPAERNEGIESGAIKAYENTLAYFTGAVDWATDHQTTNIQLWPAVSVIVASPAFLSALSDEQRAAVTEAALDTADQSFALMTDESTLAAEVCAAGGRLAAATPEALAEIEMAVAPVHAELRTDPLVAGYLDEVAMLTADFPTDSLPIPDGCDAA